MNTTLLSRRGVLTAAAITSFGAVTSAAVRASISKITFVLVHGGGHGGWCYARVAEILRRQGHRVFTPTLTGLGERSHLARCGLINCTTHIQDILNVIQWERLDKVVLCGHSYGGMVIGGVADAIAERIASLVYLDALIPQDGVSVLDTLDPQQIIELIQAVAARGDGMLPPGPAQSFNVNPGDRPMVDALCTAQPLTTLMERLKLTGRHMSIAKKTFVRATGWPGSSNLNQAYHRIKSDATWKVLEVPCGHDVMLDAPERLAEILLATA